jgi:hypothetical protein
LDKEDSTLFNRLKRETNLAKAVKSNNTKVPIHIWDAAGCRTDPMAIQKEALSRLQTFLLRVYRQPLWRETRNLTRSCYGKE